MKAYIIAGVVLLLTGCMLDPEIRFASHRKACLAYGFEADTPEFAQCIQTEEINWKRQLRGV